MAMKTALSGKASIVMIQELFIDNREICYSGFKFHLPQNEKKEIRVMKAIKKNLADKIMLDHRTDLIDHLYFMLLEIRKLNIKSKKLDRKIQVMNMYINRIRSGCT